MAMLCNTDFPTLKAQMKHNISLGGSVMVLSENLGSYLMAKNGLFEGHSW